MSKSKKTTKRKKKSPNNRKYFYEVKNGLRKRVYLRNKSGNPRKVSTYNVFQKNLSTFLKYEGIDYHQFGSNYSETVSILWSKTKENYQGSELVYASNNIEDIFVSITGSGNVISSRVEDLDDLDGVNWWELEESLSEINFTANDSIVFDFPEGYKDLIPEDLDLRNKLSISKLGNALSGLIKSRNMNSEERSVLASNGIPSSSDIFVTVEYDYDEVSDKITAKVKLPELPKYLDYEYKGIRNTSVKPLPFREVSSVEPESIGTVKTKEVDSKQKYYETQLELIKELKSLGMSNEEIKKILLK